MLEMSGDFNHQEVGKEGRATGHDEFDGLGRKEHRCQRLWLVRRASAMGRPQGERAIHSVPAVYLGIHSTTYCTA